MKKKSLFYDFLEKYNSNEACYALLHEYKWRSGYKCRSCKSEKEIKGRTRFHKRCGSCGYDESCTAHTLFHKLKFPITKAFAIIFQLTTMKKGMSSCEISRQHGICQETAWFFTKKVQLSMHEKKKQFSIETADLLIQLISFLKETNELEYIDELTTKDPKFRLTKSATTRREHKKKNRKTNRSNKRSQLLSREERGMRPFHFINLSYRGLEKIWSMFHHFNLRNWLVGIFHKISIQHLKSYFAEFLFKLRKRHKLKTLPLLLIQKFVTHQKTYYCELIAS